MKKISTYFALLAILSSIMITPAAAFTSNSSPQTTTAQSTSPTSSQSKTDQQTDSSSAQQASGTQDKQATTATKDKAASESSTTAQPRAPTKAKSINDLLPNDAEGNQTIFTSAKITDKAGNAIKEVHVGDDILLQYEWAIPESIRDQINAGDTFSFTLPKGMKIDQQLTGDLSDSQGTVFGHFEINSDGSAKITFTDNVQKHSKIKGTLFVSGQVTMSDDGTNPGLDIPFVDSNHVTVPDIVASDQVSLSKKVVDQTPDTEIKNNKASITWSLGINKTTSALKDGTTITDTLPAGVTYTGNEVLKASDVYADGSLHNEKTVAFKDVFTVDQQSGKVSFKLKDSADHQKYYELQFDTQVDFTKVDAATNATSIAIKNTAQLTQPGEADVNASASTHFGYDVNFKKEGTMQANGVIKWTITVNHSGMTLPKGTAFTDKMDNNQVLTDASGQALADISDAVKSTGPKIVASGSKSNYTFTLDEAADQAEFKLTYYTKATGQQPNAVYNNTISWNGQHSTTGKIDHTSSITKKNTKIDTANHTADYQITVNKNNTTINKATVVDQMDTGANAGLSMDQTQIKGIKVYRLSKGAASGKETVVDPDDYTITTDGEAPFTKFTLNLDKAAKDGTTDAFIIKYTANYDAAKRGEQQANTATYTYETNGFDYSKQTTTKITPGARATMKGSKSGAVNPLQRTVDWTIKLNEDQKSTFGADGKLVDTLPQGISLAGIDANAQGDQTVPKADYQVTQNGKSVDHLTATYNAKTRQLTFTGFEKGSQADYQIVLTTDIDSNQDSTLPNLDVTNTAKYSDDDNQTADLTARVSYNPTSDLLQKSAQQNDKKVTYTVKVNPDTATNSGAHKLKLKDVVITDKPDDTSMLRVDPSSFKITDQKGNPLPESQYKLSAGEQGFKLTFNDIIDQEINITYDATILIPAGTLPGQTIRPSNTATISGNKISGSQTNKTVTLIAPNAGGSAEGVMGSITLTKQDAVTHNTLQNAKFSLYRVQANGDLGNAVLQDQPTDEQGQLKFKNLTLGQYKIIETEAPAGYQISPDLAKGKTVTVSDTDDASLNTSIKLDNEAITTITGKKSWDDHDDQDGLRPKQVTVYLFANDKKVETQTITATNDWHYQFDKQPVYDEAGNKITYTIQEAKVADYTTKVTGFDLTNTHQPAVTSVKGTKTWDDHQDQDAVRPQAINIHLLADGQPIAEKTVTAATNWSYSFTELPEYKNGQKINYTITEDTVPNYTTEITGTQIKNRYTPKTTSVTVTKHWNDGQDQDGLRPNNLQVQLYANGKKSGAPVDLTATADWTHTWTDLAVNQNGQKISYTVKETQKTPGYTTQVDDQNAGNIVITNTHKPTVTSVKGTKTWDDHQDQDGVRPKAITIHLLADGQPVAEKKVTASDDWHYEFSNLPEYQNGQKINYTITEDTVKNYTTEIKDDQLINHYTPMKTSITVTKHWNDDQDQDGLRPNNLQVQLYANGKKSGEPVDLTATADWTHTWTDLAVNQNGQKISYTVKETQKTPGYTTQVDDQNAGNIVITNTHQPAVTSVKGTKTWADHDNQDGVRPKAITIHLLADGQPVAEKKVTASDDWHYQFSELPKYQNGQKINYTITEDTVPNYTTEINGTQIKNRYTPKTTSVTVTKHWNDGQDQDGLRPNNLQVQLYANGKKSGEPVDLTATADWTHTWTDLAVNQNGQKISYTVKETQKTPGYTTQVDDQNTGNIVITNTHQPAVTSVKGTKTWADHDNQDGVRPKAITIHLLADGQPVAEQKVTASDDWHYEFSNLPEYQNGQKINYTITEDTVKNYTTEIKADQLINHYTPGKTSVTVTKQWNDGQDQDGLRPNHLQVQLYANGKKSGEPVDLTATADWTYTWTNLAAKRNGQTMRYTVRETTALKGYTATVQDNTSGNIIITNSHTPTESEKPTNPGHSLAVIHKKITHWLVKHHFLPQTGEQRTFTLTIIGILILACVTGYVVKKRFKNK
ncbi:Cna B-type domain-containing protein [Loigolactobacillus bifermentans]|uniref:Cna B-type domain-containing protein n=3 Tax=Loigolactobacillus bifermentans TaxID=1607 RepID=UPI00177F8903|nr:Cna B-type domain-containing protein [Loigolactobacillus bifermentans]